MKGHKHQRTTVKGKEAGYSSDLLIDAAYLPELSHPSCSHWRSLPMTSTVTAQSQSPGDGGEWRAASTFAASCQAPGQFVHRTFADMRAPCSSSEPWLFSPTWRHCQVPGNWGCPSDPGSCKTIQKPHCLPKLLHMERPVQYHLTRWDLQEVQGSAGYAATAYRFDWAGLDLAARGPAHSQHKGAAVKEAAQVAWGMAPMSCTERWCHPQIHLPWCESSPTPAPAPPRIKGWKPRAFLHVLWDAEPGALISEPH